MSRRKKDPLSALSAEERAELERLGRSGREPAGAASAGQEVALKNPGSGARSPLPRFAQVVELVDTPA